MGHELGVAYVLEGSVRRSQQQVRITAQLIEAETGTHIWAERFDGNLNDVFELQDKIADQIVAVIEPKLLFTQVDRARRMPPQNVVAYDLFLRAHWHINDYTPEGTAAALRCLEKALEIDPRYAQAMAAAACYRGLSYAQGLLGPSDDIRHKGLRLAWDAVDLAPNDANVLWMAGYAIWALDNDAGRSRELYRRSLAINPNCAIALTLSGWVETAAGDPQRGRDLMERSQRLNPCPPSAWINLAGMAYGCIAEGKYREAVAWAEKSLVQNRRFVAALRALAVGLTKIGEVEKARQVVAELCAVSPGASLSGLKLHMTSVNASIVQTYIDALREAGLPE